VISGDREPARWLTFEFLVPVAGIVGWMLWLGVSLG